MAVALRFVLIAVVGLLLAAGPALAAGGGSKTPTGDPNYAKAEKLVKKGEYADAIPLLNKVVAADPANADAFNYLGYSHRKLDNFDDALKNYQTALPLERNAGKPTPNIVCGLQRLEDGNQRLLFATLLNQIIQFINIDVVGRSNERRANFRDQSHSDSDVSHGEPERLNRRECFVELIEVLACSVCSSCSQLLRLAH